MSPHWDNDRELVLFRLNNIHQILSEHMKSEERELKNIHSQLLSVQLEIARLKVKSGIWGAIGGMIPLLILLGIEVVKK